MHTVCDSVIVFVPNISISVRHHTWPQTDMTFFLLSSWIGLRGSLRFRVPGSARGDNHNIYELKIGRRMRRREGKKKKNGLLPPSPLPFVTIKSTFPYFEYEGRITLLSELSVSASLGWWWWGEAELAEARSRSSSKSASASLSLASTFSVGSARSSAGLCSPFSLSNGMRSLLNSVGLISNGMLASLYPKAQT